MENNDLSMQFANRLKKSMAICGYDSQRPASGTLAEITGYSPQMCRRYLSGEAIPEPQKLAILAEALKVSPGWLLFGESEHDIRLNEDKVVISKKLLSYVLSKAKELYDANPVQGNIPDFVSDLIHKVSKINADEEQSKKIIDLAFLSAKHFTD
jgi:transcriptional regulator with XRE-family HTH domain